MPSMNRVSEAHDQHVLPALVGDNDIAVEIEVPSGGIILDHPLDELQGERSRSSKVRKIARYNCRSGRPPFALLRHDVD